MLLGQDLGRRHEGAAESVFPGGPDQRRGHHGFAAAHVALDQAVHDIAGREISQSLAHGPALGAGGPEREGCVELLDIHGLQAAALLFDPALTHLAKRAGQNEELLKHQAAPGNVQRLEIGGEVDVLKGVARCAEFLRPADLLRQQLGKFLPAALQRLAHRLQDGALVERRVHPVYRYDPPRDAALAVLPLADGVGHGAAGAADLDLAVEDVALALVDAVLPVGLVKIGDVHHAALVHRAELHQVKPSADPAEPGRIRHQGADAHRLAVHRQPNGLIDAAVLVTAGKKAKKVIESKDAQLLESQRLFLSYALQVSDIRLQISHITPNRPPGTDPRQRSG